VKKILKSQSATTFVASKLHAVRKKKRAKELSGPAGGKGIGARVDYFSFLFKRSATERKKGKKFPLRIPKNWKRSQKKGRRFLRTEWGEDANQENSRGS